jgi:hypothetical protein
VRLCLQIAVAGLMGPGRSLHVYRTKVIRPLWLNKKSFNRWFFRCQNFRSIHSTPSVIGLPAGLDDLSFADNFKVPS